MRTPIQIRFTDIDIFGHVSNSVYAEWFDTARFGFISNLLPDLDPKGRSLVMVHLETDFRKQILMNDKVFLETRVVKVGQRSLGISQRIVNETDGDIHAESYGVLSTYDAARQESFPMPDAWREKLEKFL